MSTSLPATPIDVALLLQDNRSLQTRCDTMLRALNDRTGVTVVAGVYGRGATVDKLIGAARVAESVGFVPAIRFLRDRHGNVNGVELAILTEKSAPTLELVRASDGADLIVCPRCECVMADEARCGNCGRDGGEAA